MDNEVSKLRNEIIELKEKMSHFEKEVTKLNARNAELEEQIKVMKEEKFQQQQNLGQSVKTAKKRAIGEESGNLAEQMAKKRAKLSEICVPNWLIEVLAWIGRIEMANSSLPTSSLIFRELCWPKLHGNVKPHKMPDLQFFECRLELGQVRALLRVYKNKIIPIACIPPPDYIIGVEKIELGFVDDQILKFIQSIAHLIQSCNFKFNFNSPQIHHLKINQKETKTMKMVMECLGDKIVGFDLQGSLHEFNCLFPGIIESVPAIAYHGCDLDVNFLVECLTKQQSDGKQMTKFLGNSNQEFMTALIDGIKKENQFFCRFTIHLRASIIEYIPRHFESLLARHTCSRHSQIFHCYFANYRNTPHSALPGDLSPAEIVFGRKLRTKLDLLKPKTKVKPQDDVNEDEVNQRKQYRDRMKRDFDRRHGTIDRQFIVGDSVLILNYRDRDAIVSRHANQMRKMFDDWTMTEKNEKKMDDEIERLSVKWRKKMSF